MSGGRQGEDGVAEILDRPYGRLDARSYERHVHKMAILYFLGAVLSISVAVTVLMVMGLEFVYVGSALNFLAWAVLFMACSIGEYKFRPGGGDPGWLSWGFWAWLFTFGKGSRLNMPTAEPLLEDSTA